MGVRRPGFALMVVLIAVAAVFALALRGAVVARSTMLEVGAVHGRVVAERHARAAVAIAVKGIVPVQDDSDRMGAGAGAQAGGSADGEQSVEVSGGAGTEEDTIELPDFLKELIPKLAELENEAKAELTADTSGISRVADGRGVTGRVPRRTTLVDRLASVGVPSRPIRVEVEGRGFRVRMWDATGLLNVNRADEDQFVRYFLSKGVGSARALELAHQILDWRDVDRLTRSRGAEQSEYDHRGIGCRNGDIFSLEELLFLPSMDRALFDRIEDELAVGGDGLIHVGSAPRDVLASLPRMDPDTVEAVLALRRSGGISEDSLSAALPATHRDQLMQKLRIEMSGVIRVRVDALEIGSDRVVARFDGLAFVNRQGVSEVGLRPM